MDLLIHGEQGVRQKKGETSTSCCPGEKEKKALSFLPPDTVRGDDTDHWSLQANKKGWCKMLGCEGIVRSRYSKCALFLFLNRDRAFVFDINKRWNWVRRENVMWICLKHMLMMNKWNELHLTRMIKWNVIVNIFVVDQEKAFVVLSTIVHCFHMATIYQLPPLKIKKYFHFQVNFK